MIESRQGSIPIDRYMHIRSAYGPSFSHDGKRIYFLSNITGIPQVWKLDRNAPWPEQISFFPDRVMAMEPSPKSDSAIVMADVGGSERAQLFLLENNGLSTKDLSEDPEHIYEFGAWDESGLQFSYSTNKRNGKDFDVYICNIKTGQHVAVHESNYTNHAGAFSTDGKKLVFSRHRSNMDNDLFLLDIETGNSKCLTPHESTSVYHSAHFSRDGGSLYLLTNHESEFTRVAKLNLETLKWTFLTEDKWDAELLCLSKDGQFLAFAFNVEGSSQLALLPTQSAKPALETNLPKLPAGVIAEMTWSPAENIIAMTISSPLFATEVWVVNVTQGQVFRMTHASVSGVPKETFVEPELIHYATFDDKSIPAFLYRPKDANGPLPSVIYVHGGPESQSRNSFNPVIQYFVNQGFAVLVPNVRGSSGYGRTYVHLDDVRLRMDSVADLAAAAKWLSDSKTAPEHKIAVMGGSYGGFMVLAALTHYPKLWAAGVDIVGISNLRTFIENTSPYRRHLRESEYGTIEDDGEFFDKISPIHHIDKVSAPLIVLHGANDPRVPIAEAEQMVAELRKRGLPVKYLRYEDEGHGLVKLQNRIHGYGEIARFLNERL
ncbi:S9 family peptidase [Alicyclobacillus sp. SO9]|uniref:S9 family peptidase n=1 Tax=Alicyclobacillus sp. SO9 TaxID=2665646 RepID=UPI0018E77623|nr:S9 family peptidase [Alicyclobacillus sp. SO9]QQE78624.1 S9 family peptidase [Alicyclobacillus sp. SO9]